MADVIPFSAVRPHRSKVHLVASRAFYTYPKNVLEAKLDSNPYSFIHIINPEFRETEKTEPNSSERFEKVKNVYRQFKSDGILIQEESPAFYIYEQSGEYSYCGIIAGASVKDYNNDVIKKHEETLTRREQVFKTYLDICEFNAEPVLLTHRDHPNINKVLNKYRDQRAEYEFTTTDMITHSLWPVYDEKDINEIKQAYQDIDAIYIADGHHRSASSALLGNERLIKHGDPNAPDQYFMSYFLSESALKIFPFNRLIKDLNGLSKEVFLQMMTEHFELIQHSEFPLTPSKPGEFALYLDKVWYLMQFKQGVEDMNPVDSLDAKILSDHVLDPILNIKDLKTSDRIHFEGGPNATQRMIDLIERGKYIAAFSLYPVTVDQLKDVADHGLTMPPKSTWIEPKLRSGLTIYEL